MDEKIKGFCDRCSLPTMGKTTMSMFNTETICMGCKETETKHPKYAEATSAEFQAVKSGDMNFKGIGLPNDLRPEYAVSNSILSRKID